jgi:hypothetical protein
VLRCDVLARTGTDCSAVSGAEHSAVHVPNHVSDIKQPDNRAIDHSDRRPD